MVDVISVPRTTRRLVAAILPVGLVLAAQGARAQTPSGNPADVRFMSGMIIHHEQAVLMSAWAPTHDAGKGVATLCRKIALSQHDDIALMERWLTEHGQPLPDTAWVFDYTGPAMRTAHLMDGMLTVDQLTRLDAARGQEFDRLFLKYMMQHHAGALTMVKTLMASPTAGQDGLVFQFAADINSDQTVEIARMRRMLAALGPDDEPRP
jgi:uncharacterized protein (DUF305 family)